MEALLAGLRSLAALDVMVALVAGSVAGILVGALPGLGPSLGVALLIPFTYGLEPTAALVMLVSLYQAAEYGGSLTAILVSTPGTAAAAATMIDGYALTRRGRPGKAIATSLTASMVGGIFGALVLILLAPPLARLALQFGPPEQFAIGCVGLAIVASLSGQHPLKGLTMAVLGLAIAAIGVDSLTGFPRFTMGRFELLEGVPFLPVLIGLFAVAEVFRMVQERASVVIRELHLGYEALTAGEWKQLAPAFLRGSLIGSVVGAIPGAGAQIASWIAYDQEKRWSKERSEFGRGALAGIAAPEAANNACVGGALVPLLTLGIPGSPTTAILVGAMMLHGLRPGPQLFGERPDIVWALLLAVPLTAVVMYWLGVVGSRWWIRILAVPDAVLAPLILALSLVGAYAVRNAVFDVWLALGAGVVGYLLRLAGYPLPPLVLAMVLGFMVETNLRRSLLMYAGGWGFLMRPLTLVLVVVAVVFFLLPLVGGRLKALAGRRAAGGPAERP